MAHPGKFLGTAPLEMVVQTRIAKLAAEKRNVGASSLVAATPARPERQVSGPSLVSQAAPVVADKVVQVAKPHVMAFVQSFVNGTIRPAIAYFGTGWLAKQVLPTEAAVIAQTFGSTVVDPVIAWLASQLVARVGDALEQDGAAPDGATQALEAARGALPQSFILPTIGKGLSTTVRAATKIGGTTLMLAAATWLGPTYPITVGALQWLAPSFGALVSNLIDFGMDMMCPLTDVAPEDIPVVGQPFMVCMVLPAKVTAVGGKLNGTYTATVELAPNPAQPWLRWKGTVELVTGAEKRIVAITRLAEAIVTIGPPHDPEAAPPETTPELVRLTLAGLSSVSYNEHTGWSIASTSVIRHGKTDPTGTKGEPTLERLTISPVGWVDGAFVYDKQRGQLGGNAPDGLRWPLAPSGPSAVALAAPATPGLALSGEDSVGGAIHDALATQHNHWLTTYPLLAAGYLTGHANVLADKPAAKSGSGPGLFAWMASVDKTGILAGAATVDLVPKFFKSGVPHFGLKPYELKIGHEPSLSFGMRASIRLFAGMPVASASNVVVAWLPSLTPAVRLRADEVAFGDALVATGLELDPRGGVRTARATVRVPLPAAGFGPASTLEVGADYLSVGRGIDFRNAHAGAKDLRFGDVVTVDSVGVAVTESGPDPRLAVTVAGGKAKFGADSELAFDGSVAWGAGRPVAGTLAASGDKLSAFGGGITATKLSGALTVGEPTSKLRVVAEDLKLAWNQFKLETSADITLDSAGLADLAVKTVRVTLANAEVGSAEDIVYARGKGLAVGKVTMALPTAPESPLRAKRVDDQIGAKVVVTNPITQAAPVKGQPKAAPKPGAIEMQNVAALELGPPGRALVTVDFTQAAKARLAAKVAQGGDDAPAAAAPVAAGALAGVLSAKLGSFAIDGAHVEVARSENASDVRVALANVIGPGYLIKAATYDDGKLSVTDAEISPAALFGAALPAVLRGLTTKLAVSFVVDTRAGVLEAMTLEGEVTGGTVFGGLATVDKLALKLTASGGAVGKDALANGLALDGTIRAEVSAAAYGVDAKLKGTIALPSGKTVLSGSGKAGPVSVEVANARFEDGKTTFETASVVVAHHGDILKFRAWKDDLALPDRPDKIVIAARQVVLDPAGLPVAAASEDVTATKTGTPPASQPAVAAPRTRTEVAVHVPEIVVGDDAFVLRVDDFVVPDLAGRAAVTTTAKADINVGLFCKTAIVGKVTMRLPGSAPSKDPTSPDAGVVADPLPGSVKFEVTSATIGGVEMTGVSFERGVVTAASAKLATPKLLSAGIAQPLGLDTLKWTATGLAIDAAKGSAKIDSLAATRTDLQLGGFLHVGAATATVTTGGTNTVTTSVLDAWALKLTAADAKLTPVAGLDLTGSAEVDITKAAGIVGGKIDKAKVGYGGAEASVGKIALTRDGWLAKDVSLAMGHGTKAIPGLDPKQGIASWLDFPATWGIRATFDLRKDAQGVHWPTAAQRKIAVTHAGFKLPGVTGTFDRTTGKATVHAAPPSGEMSLGVKIPLAHGLGLEVGGSIAHAVALDAESVDLGGGDDLAFAGKLAGTATLKGRVRVGVYGGVPALFTVSAGLYAGIDLSAKLVADATGAWKLPKLPTEKAAGNVEAYLALTDGKEGTRITAEAGAYASINVVGFGRTIEKPLATKTIASLHAHGFARLSTVDPIALLPEGEFPKRSLRVDPALADLFTGGDTQKAIALAQKTVDRGVAKMEASEELLKAQPAALAEATPWAGDAAALAEAQAAAHGEVEELEAALAASKTELDLDRAALHVAEMKLADHKKKLVVMQKTGAKESGRAVMTKSLELRLASYRETLTFGGSVAGLVSVSTKLTASQMTTKITYKEEEITELKRRIAAREAGDVDRQTDRADAVTAEAKAARKAELAPQTKAAVSADLAKRQARLIQMYGDLHGAYKTAHDQAATKLAEDKKLEIDETRAAARIAVLEADKGHSATEMKFWKAQLAFVQEERTRRRIENAPKEIALSDDVKAALRRAKKAKPAAAAALDARTAGEIAVAETAIEVVTDKLMANHRAVDKADDKRREKLEAERGKLVLDLEKAQAQLAGALQRAAAIA